MNFRMDRVGGTRLGTHCTEDQAELNRSAEFQVS